MMGKNPLDNAAAKPLDRSGWTLQEHCEYANAQLILNGTNEWRRKQGAGPVHWVIRNGRVVCEWAQGAAA
jgi:hypothetical protein